VAGSQSRPWASSWISSSPVTNSGSATTESDPTLMAASVSEFSFSPAITPSSIERGTAISSVSSASRSELASLPSTRSRMPGLPMKVWATPQSPRTKSASQRAYCTGSGAFNPSSRRSSALAASLASRPSRMLAMSPGSSWVTAKINIEVSRSVRTKKPRRRRM